MTKTQIVDALISLDAELARRQIRGELSIVGGAVMCLVFNTRQATQDVDGMFSPMEGILAAARDVSEDHGLGNYFWLNDAASVFLSERGTFEFFDLGLKNLAIFTATADYMLAMKVLAARPSDEADILFLIDHLNLKTKSSVVSVVKKFYPGQKLKLESNSILNALFSQEG